MFCSFFFFFFYFTSGRAHSLCACRRKVCYSLPLPLPPLSTGCVAFDKNFRLSPKVCNEKRTCEKFLHKFLKIFNFCQLFSNFHSHSLSHSLSLLLSLYSAKQASESHRTGCLRHEHHHVLASAKESKWRHRWLSCFPHTRQSNWR